MLLTILVFLIILSVLVLIHEAGHFFAAKWFGIKVEEFGYGLPPRAWGKKIGETLYSINWLPIGGFVKLYGEDEAGGGSVGIRNKELGIRNKKDLKRAFFSKPPWQKALVVAAGVAMNFILAVIIYYLFLGISGFKTELPLLTPHKFMGVNQSKKIDLTITEIAKNSPAEKAGIKKFSKVLTLNGVQTTDVQSFQKAILSHKGQELRLTLMDMRSNKSYAVKLTPRVNPPKGQGALGVAFGIPIVVLSYDTLSQKIFSGITHPLNLMSYNFDVLGSLIKISVKEKNAGVAGEAVSGPVGIYKVVGNILEIKDMKELLLQLLNLAGLLSMSLAIFNILPIPALDGGRLFFILIEGITGKKVNPVVEGYIHQVGMMVLLALILLVTLKDLNLFRFIFR